MKIQTINSNSFKGYDARPLRGFLMSGNTFGIAREMQNIGKKEGFKIFSVMKGCLCTEGINQIKYDTFGIWAQDMWTFVKNSLVSHKKDRSENYIREFFSLEENKTQKELNKNSSKYKHIKGGNIYIVKGENGEEALVGQYESPNFDASTIMKMYSVDKVTFIPQMDFHVDMFIRPLDNKKILLADDEMSLNILKKGQKNLMDYISSLDEKQQKAYNNQVVGFRDAIDNFEYHIAQNRYAKLEDVEKKLLKNNFEVIRVPGRVYESYMIKNEPSLCSLCNYMNANVFKNKQGDLVYITNKSCIDDMLELSPEISKKIGFSFENEFVKSISPYIKKEHIYFVEGDENFVKNDMLPINEGGIHCACTEIPE